MILFASMEPFELIIFFIMSDHKTWLHSYYSVVSFSAPPIPILYELITKLKNHNIFCLIEFWDKNMILSIERDIFFSEWIYTNFPLVSEVKHEQLEFLSN